MTRTAIILYAALIIAGVAVETMAARGVTQACDGIRPNVTYCMPTRGE